jgi:hypothetical protein
MAVDRRRRRRRRGDESERSSLSIKREKKNVPGSQTGSAREGGGAGSARRDPIGIASASVDVSRLVSTPFVSSID